jgi:cadmium resistance protein CadD (predicted permease)
MLLKIYLGFSITSFVLILLAVSNATHTVRIRFRDKLNDKPKTDKIGLMFYYIKMLILCFIPVYNIVMFVMAFSLFMNSDKLIKMSNIEESIEKSQKHE